ncbi:MAG: helix-hairpin-helix domain-containing protein, partial [Gammaproteobacteria bacterium]|nr:helix-hairpin-helix domain-containing protein [Gammaproteobacteria bacterium]
LIEIKTTTSRNPGRNMMKIWLAVVALLCLSSVNATPVNINTADAKLIATSLRGVGIVRAEEIVKYRSEYGDFQTLNDLRKVRGVGHRIVEKNRQDILLTDPS